MSFGDRSDALIELLEELTESGHRYVLVGGYAVSAFNARFSTDLDIVVAPDSKEEFVTFLEAQRFEETDSHAKQWFYVADDGPGIPDTERDTAFDVGYSTTDDGTGFGLSIVQQVADSHGWHARVTDGPSGGARFELTSVDYEE